MLNIVVILECVTENAHAAVYVALLYSIRHTTALVRGAPIQQATAGLGPSYATSRAAPVSVTPQLWSAECPFGMCHECYWDCSARALA